MPFLSVLVPEVALFGVYMEDHQPAAGLLHHHLDSGHQRVATVLSRKFEVRFPVRDEVSLRVS